MLYDKRWDAKVKPLEEWQRLLYRAADIVDHLGHAKFALEDSRGRVCLVGAICAADGQGAGWSEDAMIALRRVQRHLGILHTNRWNNMPERTADEVTSVLRGAAKS